MFFHFPQAENLGWILIADSDNDMSQVYYHKFDHNRHCHRDTRWYLWKTTNAFEGLKNKLNNNLMDLQIW